MDLMPDPTLKQQLYLHLFHGRTDPTQEMDDWGTEGPLLGPFEAIHGTYQSTIRIMGDGLEAFLNFYEDMVFYDGVYYGDWSVLASPDRIVQSYDPAKATLPNLPAEPPDADFEDDDASLSADASLPAAIALVRSALTAAIARCDSDNGGDELFFEDIAAVICGAGDAFKRYAVILELPSYGTSGPGHACRTLGDALHRLSVDVKENGSVTILPKGSE